MRISCCCAWLGHVARRGHAWFGALGIGLAVGLASTWAVAGHAAAGLQPALALPVDVVHLLAMGLWLGGLVTVVVIVRHPSVEVSAPVYRFSSIAAGSVVVLIGTGSYQSWRQLGSWAAFVSTDYGRLLLAKLGVPSTSTRPPPDLTRSVSLSRIRTDRHQVRTRPTRDERAGAVRCC